jgi:hypothetical protein
MCLASDTQITSSSSSSPPPPSPPHPHSSVPSGLKLEEVYLKANPEAAQEGLQAISTGLSRFLDQYTKG